MTIIKYRSHNNGQEKNQENKPSVPSLFRESFPPLLLDNENGDFERALSSLSRPFWGRDMIGEFFDDSRLLGTGIGTRMPAVNIAETNDELIIEVAAPGMNKKDFKVEINNDLLSISYVKEDTVKEEDREKEQWRKEFSFESFKRTFTLPATVETEKIEAAYTNGILVITVPKKEEARRKPVKTVEIK